MSENLTDLHFLNNLSYLLFTIFGINWKHLNQLPVWGVVFTVWQCPTPNDKKLLLTKQTDVRYNLVGISCGLCLCMEGFVMEEKEKYKEEIKEIIESIDDIDILEYFHYFITERLKKAV